jgi:hypothetical protein
MRLPRAEPNARVALASLPVALAAAVGIAISASGCGGSSSIDPVAQAAEVTARLPGSRILLKERLSSPSLPQEITISGQGYVNQDDHSGQLTMSFPQVPGAPASLSHATIEMVFKYPVIYMKFPKALSSKLPGGKPWMKINVQRAYQGAGINLSGLSSTNELDPTQYLNYLHGASGHVTDLGHEEIDGVSSTHYRATVQFNRIVAHLPAAQRPSAEAAVRQLQKLGGTNSMPIDVWIDGAHRVRREQIGIHEHTNGTPIDGSVTIDYVSFGPTPATSSPPASQVYDLTGLTTSGLKRAAGG